MSPSRLGALLVVGATALLLAGCVTAPHRPVEADGTYCHRVGKISRQKLTCTLNPVPSGTVEASAKQFTAVPDAATLYIVRSSWADGPNKVPVSIDGGRPVLTVPESLMRIRMPPGNHQLTLEWEGDRIDRTITFRAGEVTFVELDPNVWAWAATYKWTEVNAEAVRRKAVKAKLIADLDLRENRDPGR